jgi:DNA-binding NarL/FixJ family response regulator
MGMYRSGDRASEIVICHPERLIAAATGAVLRKAGVVDSYLTVPSLRRLLSSLHRGVVVAIVFDAVGDELCEVFEALRYRGLATPVLVVTDHFTAERAAEALEWGASGTVPASSPVDVLIEAVTNARDGNAVFALGQRSEILEALRLRRLRRYWARQQLARLSHAEVEVLRALVDGTSVADIARRMIISPSTVRTHVRSLSIKLGAQGQLRIAAVGRLLLAAASPRAPEPGLHEAGA